MNVAIIPAKGHSSRLPRKNTRDFMGKPMLVHSIDTAKASGLFGIIAVSTDDEMTEALARHHKVEVIKRPGRLAEQAGTPDCGTQEVARHALDQLCWRHTIEYACCIYATAPLMLATDLIKGLAALIGKTWTPFVYSVGPAGQDAGQWYWGDAGAFMDRVPLTHEYTKKYYLPAERVCDINTVEDLYTAQRLYRDMRVAQAQRHHAAPRSTTHHQ